MKEYRHSVQEDMVMTSKETYSLCQKVFCCKCFHCLQNEVRLTTDIRKQTLQRMIKNFAIDDDVRPLPCRTKVSRIPSNS
jgi:hypothetical protein